MAKLYPFKAGQLFTECFRLELPQIQNINFISLKGLINHVFLMNIMGSEWDILQGHFEFLEEKNELLFIGIPLPEEKVFTSDISTEYNLKNINPVLNENDQVEQLKADG